ncbi:MAG: hypothetical protein SPI12_02305 [Actinomycetaceae bacterium]|nr:hypothetical protein [Actinomycetaceae bacterium]MDY6082681.1 hypothetical protein [Actinomycetaceae bacterium]
MARVHGRRGRFSRAQYEARRVSQNARYNFEQSFGQFPGFAVTLEETEREGIAANPYRVSNNSIACACFVRSREVSVKAPVADENPQQIR